MDGFLERRKYLRIAIQGTVNFSIKGSGEKGSSENVQAFARNVNVEGIGFYSPKKLERGTRLELEIVLETEPRPIRMEGEVRWVKETLSPEGKTLYDTGVKLYTLEQCEITRFIICVCDQIVAQLKKQFTF